MRIFVTGARGQLGTEIMARLSGTHHDVLAVDLDTCDLSDRDQALGAITSFAPNSSNRWHNTSKRSMRRSTHMSACSVWW